MKKTAFVAKGESLIRQHRNKIFDGTEAQQKRHTKAIERLKKILEPHWREDRMKESAYCRVMWM